MVTRRARFDSSVGSWLPLVGSIALLALVFAGVASVYVRRYHMPVRSAVAVYGCFLLLLVSAVAPGFRSVRDFLAGRMSGRGTLLLFVALASVPYLVYSAGTGDFQLSKLARLAVLALAVPALYIAFPVQRVSTFNWQDGCAALLLIGAVLGGLLQRVWTVPVNLDFMGRLFLIAVASWCWTFVRQVPGLRYEFALSRGALPAAAFNFFAFAVIAGPLGLLIGFTGWNPQWREAGVFLISFLEIFFFIALLEEIFFRGFLQSLLAESFHSWWKAQLLVSFIFGLFHILHAPFPNWRYVVLATIAGWFYGSAFRQGGSLVASSLTHAAVDTVWRTFFTRT